MVGGWLRRITALGPVRAASIVSVAGLLVVAAAAASQGVLPRQRGPGVFALTDSDLEAAALPSAAFDANGVLDTDLDGVPDALENILYGTDPLNATSSALAVPDGWLLRFGIDPVGSQVASPAAAAPPVSTLPPAYGNKWPARFIPRLADIYGHGRPSEWNESTQGPFDSGLDPRKWDNGGHGIPDGWLLAHGLSPRSVQPEARLAGPSGLTVREAYLHNTDPRRADTDGDGVPDAVEVAGPPNSTGRFPPSNPRRADSGGAGVCDGYLVAHGLDPSKPASSYADHDRDGATTAQEFQWSRQRVGAAACLQGEGISPRKMHSGSSRIPDGWLIANGEDPLATGVDAKVTQRATTDARPAGIPAPAVEVVLTVWDEYVYGRPHDWSESMQGPWNGGTDASKQDTDGDGLGDAWEQAGFTLAVSTLPGAQPTSGRATSDPLATDSDGDGATDQQEGRAGTDPLRQDTDFDGLQDGAEMQLGLHLDPRRADTAGDLLRDGERLDLLRNRAAALATDTSYAYAGQAPRDLRDWIVLLPGAAKAAHPASPTTLGDQALALLVSPGADLDDDGKKNILDDDIDGDRIINGPEVRPALHQRGAFRDSIVHPATDPLNPDTDGDGLMEWWELTHAELVGGSATLDPSRWDSDGDLVADGAEDGDADGLVWASFTPQATENVRPYTNLREQAYGTDPNDPQGDKDGLRDGWKAFWGLDYPTLPLSQIGEVYPRQDGLFHVPASGRPTLGEAQKSTDSSSIVLQVTTQWYSEDMAGPGETQVGAPVTLATVHGPLTYYRLQAVVAVRFQDVQAWGTNPYLADTDGDGMPDWWEVRSATLPTGLDPVKGDCGNGSPPDPLTPDGQADSDGDNVRNVDEWLRGGHPLCQDTDMAGLGDHAEVQAGLSPASPIDDASLRDNQLDTDGDGVADFTELTQTRTRHDHPDTDGDGLLDGSSRSANATTGLLWLDLGVAWVRQADGGLVFLGERDPSIATDPTQVDDYAIGVPAGWIKMRLPSHLDAHLYRPHYELGRPAWWQESRHGPWWGGADPRDEALGNLAHRLDLDGDGLDERDAVGDPAEDLYPANARNVAREILAPEALAGLQERLDAQARVDPAPYARDRNAVAHPEHEANDGRACVRLAGVRLNGTAPSLQHPFAVAKGAVLRVTGRAESCAGSSPSAGIPAVAVQAFLRDGPSFGGAVTQPDGGFAFDVLLGSGERSVTLPEGMQTLMRGQASGTVRWQPDPAAIPVGPAVLLVRSGASSTLRPAELELPLAVAVAPALSLDVPAAARTGEPIEGTLRLVDGAGAPLRHPVRLIWDGQDLGVVVPRAADGGADFELPPVPAARAGNVRLLAATEPTAGSNSPAVQQVRDIDVRRPGVVDVEPNAGADAGGIFSARGQVRSVLSASRQEAVAGAQVDVELRRGAIVVAAGHGVADARGRFDVRLDVPADLAPGAYRLAAIAKATALQDVEGSAEVLVRSRPRFLEVSVAPLDVASSSQVRALLADPDGTPLAGAVVTVRIADHQVEVQTDGQGRLLADLPPVSGPGTHIQSLESEATATHLAAWHRSERSATSATAMLLDDGILARGGDATIEARLSQVDGRPVAGAVVEIRWGDEPARIAITDAHGRATLVRPGDPLDDLGPVTVTARFAGGGGHGTSVAVASWSIQTLAAIVLPPEASMTAGDPALVGRLVDAGTGEPLARRTIELSLGGIVASRTTDGTGRFILFDAVPADAAPVRHDLRVAFPGDGGYPPVSNLWTVHVRSQVHLSCQGPAAFVVTQPARVVCDALDARGLPVHGGLMNLAVDGVAAGSTTTEEGLARWNVTVPTWPADEDGVARARLQARFNGTTQHSPAQADFEVQVIRPTLVIATAEPSRPGGLTTLRLVVSDGVAPLASHPLTVYVEDDDGVRVVTNASGVATLSLRQPDGDLRFLVRSDGGAGLAASAVAGRIEPQASFSAAVGRSPVAWMAVGVAVAAAAGATTATWLWRRTPLDRLLRTARGLLRARGPVELRIQQAYRALEDGAIGLELLQAPARTPRLLEEALQTALGSRPSPALARLIGLFEDARYGAVAMPEQACDDALRSLSILRRELRRVHGGAS